MTPLDTSTSTCTPSSCTFTTRLAAEDCALRQSWHAGCAAAISHTSIGGDSGEGEGGEGEGEEGEGGEAEGVEAEGGEAEGGEAEGGEAEGEEDSSVCSCAAAAAAKWQGAPFRTSAYDLPPTAAAATGGRDSVSATMLCWPAMCRISAVNSAIADRRAAAAAGQRLDAMRRRL
jgi:hypothetical protein